METAEKKEGCEVRETEQQKEEIPNLSNRQWWLHDFLERMAMFYPDKWWTQAEIIKECSKPVADGGYRDYENDGYQKRVSLRSHEVCAAITIDAQIVSDSPRADTIIMLEDATYKMPNTVEEGNDYLERTILRRSSKGMKSYWDKKRKLERNGQYKMFSNSGRLMPEGDERAAERFITSVVEIQNEKEEQEKEAKKNGAKKNVQPKGN